MVEALITDLQQNKVSMNEAFGKAKFIAAKNKDTELVEWLNLELFGYKNDTTLPNYRIIKCTTNVRIKTLFNFTIKKIDSNTLDENSYSDNEKRILNNVKIVAGIAQIENLCNSNQTPIIVIPDDFQNLDELNEMFEGEFQNEISINKLVKIIFTREVRRDYLIQLLNKVKHELIEILSKYDIIYHPDSNLEIKKQAKEDITNILSNIYISIHNENKQNMSNDEYINNGQASSMGPNNTIYVGNQQQIISTFPDNYDYPLLTNELSKLKAKVDEIVLGSSENDDKLEISTAILKAQKAANNKDANNVLKNLKMGGEWLLDLAKELTVNVAADAIQKSLGM